MVSSFGINVACGNLGLSFGFVLWVWFGRSTASKLVLKCAGCRLLDGGMSVRVHSNDFMV